MRWPKYRSFNFSMSHSIEHPGLISFTMDWLDLLAVQGTLKSLLQHHSSKASILWHSAFFTVQVSHCFIVFAINFVHLRVQYLVPIFTQECDYCFDYSLPLLTLLFLPQVTYISSLPFLFSTQLCESLWVFQAAENT